MAIEHPNLFSISTLIDLPIRQVVLLFFKIPVSKSRAPGVQIPIWHSLSDLDLILVINFTILLIIEL